MCETDKEAALAAINALRTMIDAIVKQIAPLWEKIVAITINFTGQEEHRRRHALSRDRAKIMPRFVRPPSVTLGKCYRFRYCG